MGKSVQLFPLTIIGDRKFGKKSLDANTFKPFQGGLIRYALAFADLREAIVDPDSKLLESRVRDCFKFSFLPMIPDVIFHEKGGNVRDRSSRFLIDKIAITCHYDTVSCPRTLEVS